MPNCLSSGFLEAEPKVGILAPVTSWLLLSGQGNKGKEFVWGWRGELSKNLVLAGDQLQYGCHWDTVEHKSHLN